jgi:hypothetical protein
MAKRKNKKTHVNQTHTTGIRWNYLDHEDDYRFLESTQKHLQHQVDFRTIKNLEWGDTRYTTKGLIRASAMLGLAVFSSAVAAPLVGGLVVAGYLTYLYNKKMNGRKPTIYRKSDPDAGKHIPGEYHKDGAVYHTALTPVTEAKDSFRHRGFAINYGDIIDKTREAYKAAEDHNNLLQKNKWIPLWQNITSLPRSSTVGLEENSDNLKLLQQNLDMFELKKFPNGRPTPAASAYAPPVSGGAKP